MSRVIRSALARRDLDQIWDYIAADRVSAADRLLARITAKCELLATQPLMGEARPDLGEGVRQSFVGNYIIFYRPRHDGIEVARVLHGARNIEAVFGQD